MTTLFTKIFKFKLFSHNHSSNFCDFNNDSKFSYRNAWNILKKEKILKLSGSSIHFKIKSKKEILDG